MNISSLLGFGLALSAATPPERVILADGVPTASVRVDDLDLSREEDVAALRRRVGAAVRTVCSSRHNPGALYLESASCRQGAMAVADQAIDNALARYSNGDRRVASIHIRRGF